MKKLFDSKGFTIVEVSLVLAIAGLIFLMIFVALPALQRSTRDTQRREDMATLANAIKKYQSNNRGELPTNWNNFKNDYIKSGFTDPNGNDYSLKVFDCGVTSEGTECNTKYRPNGFNISIVKKAKCDGEKAIYSSNPRKIAILYKLEAGTYCGDA